MGKKIFILMMIVIMSINLTSCKNKDKENVLLSDVKAQAKVEEQEIRTAIDNGNKYLEEGNYDKAKMWYERAISISKSSVDTYVKIKNKYLKKDRKDDAYRIIRLAIDNNVDVENMKKELKKIEDTFETIVINKSIYVGEDYQLPCETILNINGNNISGKITWGNSNVANNKEGTFIYSGYIPQYGRKVMVNLKVNDKNKNISAEININNKNNQNDKSEATNVVEENKYDNTREDYITIKRAYITSFTENGYKRILTLKEAEIYEGENAVNQASIDGKNALDKKSGKYYIRTVGDEEEYYVSEECSWYLDTDLIMKKENVSRFSTEQFTRHSGNSQALRIFKDLSKADQWEIPGVSSEGIYACLYIKNDEIVTEVRMQDLY